MTTQPEQTNKIGLELTDEIGLITEQAKGVLLLLSINMDSDNKANDEIAKAAVDSAIASIDRIDGIIRGAKRIVGKDAQASAEPTTTPNPNNSGEAYGVILACTRLLEEFMTDDCAVADGNKRAIPTEVNNAFIKGELINAIRLASGVMNRSEGGAA